MRRDKLDRAIKAINFKTPRWFSQRCTECQDDVKGEQMWYFNRYVGGSSGYPSLCYKSWVCMVCAPNMSDVFIAHKKYFDQHYGDLDLTPILDEEEEMGGWFADAVL